MVLHPWMYASLLGTVRYKHDPTVFTILGPQEWVCVWGGGPEVMVWGPHVVTVSINK